MSSLNYRYDIEGLRAIAVLAVLAYHVVPWIVPGGFVGVDIFFVISGYLITRNIWKDLQQGEFSFGTFYAKRIRRLFPALTVVLLFCALVVILVGLPGETHEFGWSAISATLYVSNHYFLSIDSYFDSSLAMNPLLHTWSLSVEEQFYIVFPALLVLLHRRTRTWTFAILCGLLVGSFVFSELLIHSAEAAAFFIAPSRFWQFLIGALIALKPTMLLQRRWMELIAWVGLILISLSIAYFSEETPFPGIYAVIPTLGSACLIYAGQQQGLFIGGLLKNAVASFFGKISYSLYLWHWPLIVFYKLEFSPEPSSSERYLLIIASIVVSYISWRFIEQPFRVFSTRRYKRRIYAGGVITSLVLLVMGFWLIYTDGIKSRYSSDQLAFVEYLEYDADPLFRTDTCFLTSKVDGADAFDEENCITKNGERSNVLILGDSHAAQYYAAFKEVYPDIAFSQITASGCRPVKPYDGEKRCTDLMRAAFEEYAPREQFDAIILAGRWERNDLDALPKTIRYLNKVSDQIIVLGPVIEYRQALPRVLAKNGLDEREIKETRRYSLIKDIDVRTHTLLSTLDVEYYSILDIMCPNQKCWVQTPDGMPVQFDASHLTYLGAVEVVRAMEKRGLLARMEIAHRAP